MKGFVTSGATLRESVNKHLHTLLPAEIFKILV